MSPRAKKISKATALAVVAVITLLYLKEAKSDADRRHYNQLDRLYDSQLQDASPHVLGIMVSLAGVNYQGPADRPSVQLRLKKRGRVPAIIDLAGCGFPTWGKDVPMYTPVFNVWDNTRVLHRSDIATACRGGDYALVETILSERLEFAIAKVVSYDWIDRDRILLVGSGEAGPIVARYQGKVFRKLIWADPCSLPWSDINVSASLTLLLSKEPQGLSIERGAKAFSSPMGRPCKGIERPTFPASADVKIADGVIYGLSRPGKLMDAQRTIYHSLRR